MGGDRIGERRQIDLVQCLGRHRDIGATVIGDVVLGLSHHALGLDAADLGRAQRAGQQRVLAERIVGAALLLALDVDEGLERDVDAVRAGVAADHVADRLGILGAEGGGERHGRRRRRRDRPRENTPAARRQGGGRARRAAARPGSQPAWTW